MWRTLSALLDSILKGSLKTVLLGAGVGITSYAVLTELFNFYVVKVTSGFSQASGSMLQLAALAGLDQVISIILSAILIRVSIKSAQLSFHRKG
ncbi:MAG: DUF2523 family protein [Pseudomonadota bacterium]|nr:DUF2523 family protein [Pseudomonadota bacterium]